MKRDYVVSFLVEDSRQLSDELEGALLQEGNFVVQRQCGTVVIEGEIAACNAFEAGKELATALRSHGISVRSALQGLVTMADIHRRAGVSKQAVSNWVNSPRKNGFPLPVSFTDKSPLWDWQLVNEWLRSRGYGHDAWDVPTVEQSQRINEWLVAERDPKLPGDHRPVVRPVGTNQAAPTTKYRYSPASKMGN